ncbi:hypothetical protein AB0M80_01855 [Amycolatopsis sp. NPDC051045]|uniref:hypothetical protein n=1 Tax=Amycolatopsis sp. NPDC051045 TaxID=3156922 RepID=UPI0034139D1B
MDGQRAAVAENAAWCALVGGGGRWGPRAWSVAVLSRGENLVVAHRGDDVAGLSNFSGPDEGWPGAVAAVASAFPGLPVVGYEHGEALQVALGHGARPLGPLRVWVSSALPEIPRGGAACQDGPHDA